MAGTDLAPGEVELLVAGLDDDIDLGWAMVHLRLTGNPPPPVLPPKTLEAAFLAFRRLVDRNLIRVGALEYVDGGPPGRVAPLEHVAEELGVVRTRVENALATANQSTDWAFHCWIVNTPQGDDLARQTTHQE
jgi:hypothetical protein